MELFRIRIRSAEFHMRLRKGKSPHPARRQGQKADFTLPAGKAALLQDPDIVLREKKVPDPLIGNTPDLTDLH